MSLRDRLKKGDAKLLAVFEKLTVDASPLLETVDKLFPDFTRHDPSHVVKLEQIAEDLLKPQVCDQLTSTDLFVLLCALWIHDAGMASNEQLEATTRADTQFQQFARQGQRLGLSEAECHRLFVRDHHHEFCPQVARTLLGGQLSASVVHWIGEVAKSHGEATLHDRNRWPKVVAVDDGSHIHAPLLGAVLRLADILHFNSARAPEFMAEHRKIGGESLRHWRAHQVAADYTIADDICFFDGVSGDDEAYWFAQQFVESMDREVLYCVQDVFPTLDQVFVKPLRFSRVRSRIIAKGFVGGSKPVRLRVEAAKFLGDLLTDNLYAGKPTWFRETLQNAFDAARDRVGLEPGATPEVAIEADTLTGVVEFSDSGIGMKRSTVEDFLLVAGASYWKSSEYLGGREKPGAHVGRFGIGFLSLLGVAEGVEVETRHVSEHEGWRFTIRSADRVVRVEPYSRSEAGTTVRVRMRPSMLEGIDLVDLFDKTCTFPEFPTTLRVDGRAERTLQGPLYPDITSSGIDLSQDGKPRSAARLVRENLKGPGFRGDFYMPKVRLSALQAFVPAIRGWEQTAGWTLRGSSNTIFGGINYPTFHSVGGSWGYTHLPSIGIMRLVVEPETYALEMNLAREQFVAGEATNRLLQNACKAVDKIIASDMRAELAGRDLLTRSAISARHSYALLNLWLGQVPSLSGILQGRLVSPSAVALSPWEELSRDMAENLVFACMDLAGKVEPLTIQEMTRRGLTAFALGRSRAEVDPALIDSLRRSYPEAYLLLGIPDPDFGVLELRQWAKEQVLVPVLAHSRSLFGVRLGLSDHPYAFFPGPLDHLGIPTANGPSDFAVLDYRDFMAEAKARPVGNDVTVGCLNLRHNRMSELVNELRAAGASGQQKRAVVEAVRVLKKALELGSVPVYDRSSRASIVHALTEVAVSVNCAVRFSESDLPAYFDSGASKSFGLYGLCDPSVQAIVETQTLEPVRWQLT